MIAIPSDPVQDLLDLGKRFALTLMDEQPIIDPGESMKIIPSIGEPISIYFERLETEPQPRRRIAQQHRRQRDRSQQRLVTGVVLLCSSLYAARRT